MSWKWKYELKDTDSAAAFAFPGTAERVVSERFNVPWLGGHANIATADALDLTDVATQFYAYGTQIQRWPGTHWPGYPSSAQPAWAKIDVDHPLYLMIDKEIMSTTTPYASLVGTAGQSTLFVRDPETGDPVTEGPYPAGADVVGLTRGAFGTAAVSHENRSYVWDVTIPIIMAQKRIHRFGSGAARVEVTAPLSKAWIQYGDLVTLEWDNYIGYGLDGLVSGDGKWEVVLKELDIYADPPNVRFVLVFAGTSSPTTTSRGSPASWYSVSEQRSDAVGDQDFARGFVSSGIATSAGAGLTADVTDGVVTDGFTRKEAGVAVNLGLEASKDNYITVDQASGVYIVRANAFGTGWPIIGETEVKVSKVVTGAAAVTSVDNSDKPTTGLNGGKVIDGTTGIVKLDLNQQYGGPLNANSPLTMYSRG